MQENKKNQNKDALTETQPTYAELRAWCGTVQYGNFSRAAKALGLSPTTVQLLVRSLSQKIERLLGPEARLYTYDAATRRIHPTEEIGQKLYDWADAAVANIDRAEEFIKKLRTSEKSLRVAASLELWEHQLIDVVGQIRRAYPDLSLQMFSRGSHGSLKLLRSHRCHLAFVGEPALTATTLPGRMRWHEYRTVEVTLFLPAGSDLALDETFQERLRHAREGDEDSRKSVLQTIASQRLILMGRQFAFRQQLDEVFHRHGIDLEKHDVQEFDVARCVLAAVAAGLGVTILQPLGVNPALEPALTRIPLKGVIPDWRILAVWDALYMTEPARELVRRVCGVENSP